MNFIYSLYVSKLSITLANSGLNCSEVDKLHGSKDERAQKNPPSSFIFSTLFKSFTDFLDANSLRDNRDSVMGDRRQFELWPNVS